MKICIFCGYITHGKEGSCPHCENKDLRVVTSMRISLGEYQGKYEYSEEELKFLKLLTGVEVVS